jgi:uncharacterized SAM-binding protein YcdF (DUF218 family)
MAESFKLFHVPGSVQFLAVGLALGVGLLYGGSRLQRWGRRWLTGLLPFYLFLCTPVGADLVSAPLTRRYPPVETATQVAGLDTVVAITTGSWVYKARGLEADEMGKFTSFNALETARVCRLMGSPTVLVTGGMVIDGLQRLAESEVMADGLVRLGVPRDRILLETRSHNTGEQAANSAEMLRKRGTKRFVLVTDSEHMTRALAAFRALGLDPLPSASSLRVTTAPGVLHRLRPTIGAFLQSDRACYEYFAIVYYWSRGLLRLESQ